MQLLTLMGPNKPSDMTDAITGGIQPDMEMLAQIVEQIPDNMESLIGSITANISSQSALEEKAAEVMISSAVSEEDKRTFQQTMLQNAGYLRCRGTDIADGIA